MEKADFKTRFYKKSTFVTHLPESYLYSPTHYWLNEVKKGRYQVGVTKFSTRMLGNLVDFGFESKPGDVIEAGQIIGWIEGFKAITDIYCVGTGNFIRLNPDLENDLEDGWKKNYTQGWLFEFSGKPDSRCMHLDDYTKVLDTTIEKILEEQRKADEKEDS